MAILIQGNTFVSRPGYDITGGGGGGLGGGGGSGGGSLAIENCKGHVHVFSDSDDSGRSSGFYELEPPIPEADGSKALIQGVPLGFHEIVQPTVTLDDKRTLYVFGSAWNEISVSGILLLGQADTKGAQLSKLIEWYNSNRVSEKRDSVRVSLGTSGVNAYVTGLTLAEADPRTNTQRFNIKMLTAEIQS